jgi:eukaryotic-like serine/threonine-protein kinase
MAIAIGQQLGSYEITALLGKGGMGEVYRARDTKLKRDVAIKILPGEFSLDADRLSRFQREAEVLASLNHPNIGAIYDVQQAEEMRFLVLELVEGETLEERIQRGPIPVKEALDVAKHICEALEAAHEKGVVHRDLKPANVKITPDGKVKVLDFGLAKAMDSGPASTTLSNSPTLTIAGTNAGLIIGTAAYMSPEQARGRPADQRSDVFAFGCVLYEMLTGRRAFTGDEVSDVLASVLAREPDMSLVQRNLNGQIPDLLRRCLDKDRKRRWYAVGDLRIEIEAIAAAPYALPIPAVQAAKPQPLWVRAIPVLVAAIVFSAIASVVTWNLKRTGPANVLRFPLLLPEGQGFTSLGRHMLALSPDGTRLVYVANGQLFLRSMAEMETRPIAGTNLAAQNPFFSPDGQWIGFYSGQDATLKKIAVTGGAPLMLCKVDNSFFSASWIGDVIVFAQGGKGIMRVSANGGDPELVVAIKPSEVADGAQLINGGRSLLFTLTTEQGSDRWDKAQTIVQSLSSGERKVILRGGSDARYLPTGHLVYAFAGTLLAVPFDVAKGQVQGGPLPILEGVMRSFNPAAQSAVAQFAFSPSGSLVFVPGPSLLSASVQTLVFADRNGKVQTLALPPQPYMYPRISPDGKQLAVATDDGKEGIVWIYDLKGGSSLRRLTFGGRNLFPIWTPDSQYITFQSDREGDRGLFKQSADGSGSAERLIKAEQGTAYEPEAWSPDGKILAFDLGRADDGIGTLSPGAPKPSVLVDVPDSNQRYPAFSPDGRWFAYTSSESSQRGEVYVQPFPPTGAKYQISTEGGRAPVWSRDGNQIFYQSFAVAGTSRLFAVEVRTQPAFTFGKPMPLAIEGITLPPPPTHRNFDITPDGKQFIVVQASKSQSDTNQSSIPQINVVLNWFTELQQRVPVK